MISRRFYASPSSLIVELLLLSSNRSCHRHYHLHRRGYCSLMAVVSPSLLGQGNIYKQHDKKGFHFLSRGTLIQPKSWNKNVVIKSVAGNDNSSNGGDYSSKSLYKGRRPRAIAPSMPQLVHRDSEKINGIVEENADWFSNRGAYHTIGLSDEGQLEKMVVAVDVDEVLGNFVSALNKFIADRYSMNHSVSEYHVYEFFKIWNCSRVEADIRVHEFFKTSYFKKGIHPIPGALQALKKLSRFCSLSVVTSRQNAIKDHTIQWIEQHFPGLFQEIQFGNHFALDGQSRPKSDICRSLGASVLIDDNPRYAAECAEAGIKVLLFDYKNSYPWSKSESVSQHPLVVKVHNWEEVEHQLVSHNLSRKIS